MNILPSNQLGAPDEKDPTEKFKVGDYCKSKDAPIQERIIMQEGFGLSSPQLKAAKKRKNDMLQLYGHRIIRSTGGKDRHSKVCTARGPKDRRVRLSPKTAISFYDVQERLGYHRPSEAIDWLMNKAKSAIDALDQPPPAASNVAEIDHNVVNSNSQHMLKTEIGIIEKTEHSLKNDDPISSFGFFRNEERISSAPFATPPEIFDSNLEIARLLNFPTPADLGHSYVFTDREPLQSRISNYSPLFPGVNLSNGELLNFTGAATFKEDEMVIIPVSRKTSSTPSFLY